MKKIIVVLFGILLVSCFTVSEQTVKDMIVVRDSVKLEIEQKILQLQKQILSTANVYKEYESAKKDYDNIQVQTAGVGEIFGCTPSKPTQPIVVKPPEVTHPVAQTPPVIEEKPQVKKVEKPAIIDVKSSSKLVNGRMIMNSWKVKLNKLGIDKVKKGAKVRIFIDYCYYESGQLEKDGTVTFNINWHPPVKGKIGVALFMQTNTPQIGSGVQYCSIVMNV